MTLTRATLVAAAGGVAALGLLGSFFLVFAMLNPPMSAFMARQWIAGVDLHHRWVRLDEVAPVMVRAVVLAEDGRFCRHRGIDMAEFDAVLRRAGNRVDQMARGASTISMQVAKNLFLWPDQSFARKGLELVITPVMETFWSKRRIMEVYLNVAELGPGIFGVEAAARHHFGTSASSLTARQASLLAKALPAPIARDPARPGRQLNRLAQDLERRLARARPDLRCLET
ncbi:MAG: monofunctional biosynthetic peptidoglycan transglycosylase [Hyphomicrobiaceae bacterium]